MNENREQQIHQKFRLPDFDSDVTLKEYDDSRENFEVYFNYSELENFSKLYGSHKC